MPPDDEEVCRFRAEAAELLGTAVAPATEKEKLYETPEETEQPE